MERFEANRLEDEQAALEAEQAQERLHRALRDAPGEVGPGRRATPEARPKDTAGAAKDAAAADRWADERRASAASRKFQGELGEQEAAAIAVQRLDLTGEVDFAPGYHGFDGIYRDEDGRLVALEAKFTKEPLDRALKDTKYGPQMSEGWVDRKARLMHSETSRLHTPGNDRIGIEILDAKPGDVRRVAVLIHPETLQATAYEADAEGRWKLIDAWDAASVEPATLPDKNWL